MNGRTSKANGGPEAMLIEQKERKEKIGLKKKRKEKRMLKRER
jgi:hypothetical protein